MAKIKLLHLADTHLGVESYGRLDPATGLSTRLADFTACLDEAIAYAIDERVHLVVFAGDAYRSRDPNQTYQREFAKRIKRLSQAGIPVFLLVGNHDLPVATGRANSVDIFETLAVDNVYIGRVRNLQVLSTLAGPVQVVSVPWLTRNWLLSKDEFKGKNNEEINQLIVDSTAHFVEQVVEKLDVSLPTIVVAHASVLGAVWGSEKGVTLGHDFVLPKSVLARPSFDYVALGHVHRHQVLSNQPLMVYAGSIERVDFGEEKEPKGFVVAEVEKGSASYRFVPVKARRFVTIEVDADCEEPTERIVAAVERAQVADSVVRLIVKTSAERDALVDYQEVRRALRTAYHVAAITRRIERPNRMSFAGRLVEEMTPREALELYLRNKQVAPERQKTLLEHAEKIIVGLT
ncbi:MAG: metallophosphoesterase family protein [Chloroflexota bacterium]